MILVGCFYVDHRVTVVKQCFGRTQGSRDQFESKKKTHAETGSQKSMRDRTKTEPKWSPNEGRNRQHFEKYRKKCILKTMRKKGAERNRQKTD